MKANKSKFSARSQAWRLFIWPFLLSLSIAMLSEPLSQSLHIPRFLMPVLSLLVWIPFLIVQGVRQWRQAEQEKQALQAKFDAADKALLGGKSKSS